MQNGVPSIFTLQAKDEFGANISSADDLVVYLIAEDVCIWDGDGDDCILDAVANDNLAGLSKRWRSSVAAHQAKIVSEVRVVVIVRW